MNTPYKGRFKVSQIYKGLSHKGLDLVGIDSKDICSTVDGIVEASRHDTHHTGGMGLYIRIKENSTGYRHYFAHLSKTYVKVGQSVKVGDKIGVEGNTGHSFGSHLHYEIRKEVSNKTFLDVSKISGIPNKLGIVKEVVSRGVILRVLKKGTKGEDVKLLQKALGGLVVDGSFGNLTERRVLSYQKEKGLVIDGSVGAITQKSLGFTNIPSSNFRVDVYSKKQVWFAGTPFNNKRTSPYPVKTLKQWASDEGASVVYNLAFFNMGGGVDMYGAISGRTITYLKAKGKDVGYGGVTQRIHVNGYNICGGHQLGILDGKAVPVKTIGKRALNANGMLEDGGYFHVQSIKPDTLANMIKYMNANYKVKLLLVQDCGGSVGKYDVNTGTLIAPEKESVNGRAVASVVCIKE